ncbi:MAG: ABC transporter ATP-binding protein, partial [Crocinitomicaceae bacterium]
FDAMTERSSLNYTVFKRLLAYAKDYKGLFAFSVMCTLILAFLGPIRPKVIGVMVSDFLGKAEGSSLIFWTVIVVVILIFEGLFQFLSSYFSNLFAQSIIRDLRKKLMQHILTFRMKYFDRTPIGALVTRVVSDLEAITEVFSSGLMNIAGDSISLIVVIILMFIEDWTLAFLTLFPIPILIIATRIFARVIRGALQLERDAVNGLNVFVHERLTGMSLVQLFNRQERELLAFKDINKKHRRAHINAVWAYSIFFPVVELLSSLSIAFLLVWGALNISGNSEKEVDTMYATIASFTLWVHMLFRPIRQMADRFNILQKGTVRAERVFDVLDRENQIQDNGSVIDCNFDQRIYFRDVSFAYVDEDWVLKNINIEIESGITIAFVGATGAGKTSIVNLLGRFYDYQKGDIFIGATEISEIQLDYLRKNIAMVLQDVFLFSDTILNNIRLGDETITREDVINAAKEVGAHDFIMQLPDNYDYQVGERGGVLSSGQRQLLAFIRAYVYNPHILILDEATSSVDNESEELIQRATEKLTQGRTSIVIAHRLSTVQNADMIIVLEKGEVVEQGTHEELLNKDGHYRKLYDIQFTEVI